MYLFFANISSQNDRNGLSRNKLKSIFKFQYSTLPIETIRALLNNVFVLVCTIQKVTHRAITIASHVFFESLQDCVLFHVKAITGLLCEWGFVRRNFLARFRRSRGSQRQHGDHVWRYDWQRQQLDWLKGQRSELYFRMFIVKFSNHNGYERNNMYRLLPTFFFKPWTWRRFTTRFTRERGRTWKKLGDTVLRLGAGWDNMTAMLKGPTDSLSWRWSCWLITWSKMRTRMRWYPELIFGEVDLIIWQEIIFLPAIHLISI